MTIFLILFLLKSFADTILYLYLTSLKHSISTKNIILLTIIFAISFLSNCWKIYIKYNFLWFFLQFQILLVSFPSVFLLVNPLNFLQFYWFLLFSLGSFGKLHARTEFSIPLSTEHYMINGTKLCNFPHFYWCPVCCFLTRYL